MKFVQKCRYTSYIYFDFLPIIIHYFTYFKAPEENPNSWLVLIWKRDNWNNLWQQICNQYYCILWLGYIIARFSLSNKGLVMLHPIFIQIFSTISYTSYQWHITIKTEKYLKLFVASLASIIKCWTIKNEIDSHKTADLLVTSIFIHAN